VTVPASRHSIELTPTAAAAREFLDRIQSIDGARLDLMARASEGVFRVKVPRIGEGAGREALDLETELLDRYPGARLDVWLVPDHV
jgi:hypothetical protein